MKPDEAGQIRFIVLERHPETIESILREIVLHGMTVGAVGAGTSGEVDGTADYKGVLPVASGVIQAADVPEPGSFALLGPGLGPLGWARAKNREA